MAVLWLAVLPAAGWNVLGKVGTAALDTLALASIAPGLAIFGRSYSGDLVIDESCLHITGHEREGGLLTLYETACPAPLVRLKKDRFDEFIDHATSARRLAPLRRDWMPLGGRVPEVLRSFVALGDYFCHSRLAHSADLEKVTLLRVRALRDYTTGELVIDQIDRCTWQCSPDTAARPRCSLRTTPHASTGAAKRAG